MTLTKPPPPSIIYVCNECNALHTLVYCVINFIANNVMMSGVVFFIVKTIVDCFASNTICCETIGCVTAFGGI
jgi:hypothetical protein